VTPLSSDALQFRRLVIDALWRDDSFGYVEKNRFIGTCPLCGDAVGVTFAGRAPRASLNCHGGCSEAELAAAIGLEVRP
jgi:hypothetical protein